MLSESKVNNNSINIKLLEPTDVEKYRVVIQRLLKSCYDSSYEEEVLDEIITKKVEGLIRYLGMGGRMPLESLKMIC